MQRDENSPRWDDASHEGEIRLAHLRRRPVHGEHCGDGDQVIECMHLHEIALFDQMPKQRRDMKTFRVAGGKLKD